MVNSFVIDENVVRNAWHGKKPDGSDALAEEKFVGDMLYGNHSISISEKIRNKFSKFKDDNFGKSKKPVNDLLLASYVKLLFDSERTQIHIPTQIKFEGVKECDNEFVGVAIKSQGLLVSADGRLKEEIAKEKDPIVQNCKCETVEDAIKIYQKS